MTPSNSTGAAAALAPNLKAGDTTMVLKTPFAARRNWSDWLFAAALVVAGVFVFMRFGGKMDGYEQAIFAGLIPCLVWLGWFWRPLRTLVAIVAAASLLAIAAYGGFDSGDLKRAETVFWLKYFLSSQSAILWMSLLFFISTIFYWLGFASKAQADAMESLGSKVAWAAVCMALVGTMVRWYEGHQLGPDIGHIPVSNLYEVFVLFCWMTTLFYLYYEAQYKTRALGAFAMLW